MNGDGTQVLVCEDDPRVLRALRIVLRDAGFAVIPAVDVEDALDQASLNQPRAAIIDLVLPDGDGVELCRQLRGWSEMPIIVLSGLADEDPKVRALQAGADDYVVKPFGSRELVARLRGVLRRRNGPDEQSSIAVNGLEVDLAARVVRRDGEEVDLTPIEFDLLRVLARKRGRVLTRQSLLAEVWGDAYAEDSALLRTHVARLRAKIERDGARGSVIRTEPGVGYRFLAET